MKKIIAMTMGLMLLLPATVSAVNENDINTDAEMVCSTLIVTFNVLDEYGIDADFESLDYVELVSEVDLIDMYVCSGALIAALDNVDEMVVLFDLEEELPK